MTKEGRNDHAPLRVLAADEDREALDSTAQLLRGLGHEVTALAIGVREVADRIAAEDPDLSVVVVHDDHDHALDLITEIAEFASGPVIVLSAHHDAQFAGAAAERGIDAIAPSTGPQALQSAIEVAVRRHGERTALAEQVDQLETALSRRALIERAKGILMERYGIGEGEAFERLRHHARGNGRSVVAVATAVSEGHALLPRA